jgi:membrane-bound ClpP family serine protease
MASPGLAWLILVIGGAALYTELQSPGIGIGAFLAAVCFVLFFWSRFLDGTAAWLEILLFLMGLTCFVLELFVLPGFGIFGLGGGALILVSLVLASQTFILPSNEYQVETFRDSIASVVLAGVVTLVTIGIIRRYLPQTPVFGQMFLAPPSEEQRDRIADRERLVDFSHLMGRQGVATTRLVPAGKARIGGQVLDVLSDGDVLDPGTHIEVVEVHGNRVIVRALSRNA